MQNKWNSCVMFQSLHRCIIQNSVRGFNSGLNLLTSQLSNVSELETIKYTLHVFQAEGCATRA